jgi:hypothetical protein
MKEKGVDDDLVQAILGAGLLNGALLMTPGVVSESVLEDEQATNQLLVKVLIGGEPEERGYLVTVTIPK